MASLGTITLAGYVFSIYPRSATFKAIGAVYVMAKKTAQSNYTLIYVGETGDASERPFNHHRSDCFDRHGADHVFLRSESKRQKRLDIETAVRQKYDPPCNKQ